MPPQGSAEVVPGGGIKKQHRLYSAVSYAFVNTATKNKILSIKMIYLSLPRDYFYLSIHLFEGMLLSLTMQ